MLPTLKGGASMGSFTNLNRLHPVPAKGWNPSSDSLEGQSQNIDSHILVSAKKQHGALF